MRKLKEVTYFGIRILVEVFEHEYDDEVLLMRIRESQRRANIGGVRHEPGNKVMSDIPVDIGFSYQCCSHL